MGTRRPTGLRSFPIISSVRAGADPFHFPHSTLRFLSLMAEDDDDVAGGGGGGGGGAGDEELWQCSEHPYRAQPNPGGICALCLQEKLGQLVSSSKTSSPFTGGIPSSKVDSLAHSPPTASSSSSSSFAVPPHPRPARSRFPPFNYPSYSHRRSKKLQQQQPPARPFELASSRDTLKRSKSVAPRPPISEEAAAVPAPAVAVDSPRKKGFWSFLYHLNRDSSNSGGAGIDDGASAVGVSARRRSVSVTNGGHEALSGSPSQASSSTFGRKVARSRSVGCGSRSFSGDFLERISNGFGDCTLRRVESQREPKPRPAPLDCSDEGDDDGDDDDAETQRNAAKCAGFFGVPSVPSYWISTAVGEGCSATAGARASTSSASRSHRGWGWAFASPMRALRPTSTSSSSKSMASTAAAATPNSSTAASMAAN